MKFKVGDIISNDITRNNGLITEKVERDGEVFFEIDFIQEKYNGFLWSLSDLKEFHRTGITKLIEEYTEELHMENNEYAQKTIEHFSFIEDLNDALERITKFVEGEL